MNKDIEMIKWAFEKGYSLGHTDSQEGIFLDLKEVLQVFLEELEEVVPT